MKARQCGHMRRESICTILQPSQRSHVADVFCYNLRSCMAKTEREYREDIVQIGRLMFQKDWVAANDGNITIRLDADRILSTPTGVCKGLPMPPTPNCWALNSKCVAARAPRTRGPGFRTRA